MSPSPGRRPRRVRPSSRASRAPCSGPRSRCWCTRRGSSSGPAPIHPSRRPPPTDRTGHPSLPVPSPRTTGGPGRGSRFLVRVRRWQRRAARFPGSRSATGTPQAPGRTRLPRHLPACSRRAAGPPPMRPPTADARQPSPSPTNHSPPEGVTDGRGEGHRGCSGGAGTGPCLVAVRGAESSRSISDPPMPVGAPSQPCEPRVVSGMSHRPRRHPPPGRKDLLDE